MADAKAQQSALPPTGGGWITLYGLAMILFGVVAFAWPFASAVAFGYFLGWSFSIAGIFAIVAGFRAHKVRTHRLDLFIGLLALLTGLMILLDPLLGDLSILFVLAFRFSVAGVLEIGHAIRFRADRISLLLLGIVDLFLSAVFITGVIEGDIVLASELVGLGYAVAGLAAIASVIRSRWTASEVTG